MKSLKTWGGLVLVLLALLTLVGCGGRGDTITNPPPPEDGGGGNNPPPYTGPAWTISGPTADGGADFKAVILGTSCGTNPNDVAQYYLGGILSWDDPNLMPHGVKSVENGWVFVTFHVPANTPDKDVAFPTNVANCWGNIILTDTSTIAGPKYHVPFSQHTRQDGGGNPGTYLDVLSGSTDSTVNAATPFKLSNPSPGRWHLRQYTNGANIWSGVDGDWTHYVPTIGGPLFTPDPIARWESPGVIVADFPTPPDGSYIIWYPLWHTGQVNQNLAGSAFAVGGKPASSNRYGQPVRWSGGTASWWTP